MKNQETHQFSKEKKIAVLNVRGRAIKASIAAVLVFISAGAFYGCKKANENKPVCRIITAALSSLSAINHFSYNSDGKLGLITNGNVVTFFDYSRNFIISRTLDSGRFSKKDIITINADGLAINVRTENNATGTNWVNNAYEYSGQELVRSVLTRSSNNDSTISTYTWRDHNMVSITTGGTTLTLDYYPGKPIQMGDYFPFAQLLQGYEIIRNKNLLNSYSGSTFIYEFGSDGNISTLRISSPGNVNTISYDYECR